jgi:rhodanese-related sulfurtransferase
MILLENGFSNVTPILGGFAAWIEAGYPVDTEEGGQSASPSSGGTSEDRFTRILPENLQVMLENKDFLLINVHIPIEGNIPGTDLEIPFDDVASYIDELPEDETSQIIVYCKGESMSLTAAQSLLDLGYRDVTILTGGYIGWQEAGYPLTRTP